MKIEYLLFLNLYFIGLIIRSIYERLKKSDRIDPKSKVVFLTVFIAMCLMWASWFNMCPLDPLRLPLPPMAGWVGFGLFLIGLGLAVGAVIQLRGVEHITHLETQGLFAIFRHPMYTGFVLWIFGWAIYHGAAISLIAGLVAVINILNWRKVEEDELESKYGETYLKYRNRTWF